LKSYGKLKAFIERVEMTQVLKHARKLKKMRGKRDYKGVVVFWPPPCVCDSEGSPNNMYHRGVVGRTTTLLA